MGGWTDGGADLFVGVTRTGKTTKAKRMQLEDCARLKLLPVTLDLERASDWAGIVHAQSADHVLHCLYVQKIPPPPWTPSDEFEREKFWKAISYWGRAAVLTDGVPVICNGHYFEPAFRAALYAWGHGKLGPTVHYLVAQRFSLLHRDVFSSCRTVYIFRQAPGADADRVWQEFKVPQGNPKIPGSGTTGLLRGEYVPIQLGLPPETPSRHDARPDPVPGIPPGGHAGASQGPQVQP